MTLRLNPSSVWNAENTLLESLISESIAIWGQDFFYIPRTLVSKDNVVGEDRLSQFKHAYPIVCYMENSDGGFAGAGAMASKFGLTLDQTAELSVSRKEWSKAVGRFGASILPNRPSEGDLIYFPMTTSLFEITFVQHQTPFYQAGQLYVYRMNVELFRYSSEHITTGVEEIDVFESLKSEDVSVNATPPSDSGATNATLKTKKADQFWNPGNPFGSL